jgi:hypothetical protein
LFRCEIVRPSVGVEDGAVEFVVEFAEDADEAGFVNGMVFLGERPVPSARSRGRWATGEAEWT